jgi:hypothetical protein
MYSQLEPRELVLRGYGEVMADLDVGSSSRAIDELYLAWSERDVEDREVPLELEVVVNDLLESALLDVPSLLQRRRRRSRVWRYAGSWSAILLVPGASGIRRPHRSDCPRVVALRQERDEAIGQASEA